MQAFHSVVSLPAGQMLPFGSPLGVFRPFGGVCLPRNYDRCLCLCLRWLAGCRRVYYLPPWPDCPGPMGRGRAQRCLAEPRRSSGTDEPRIGLSRPQPASPAQQNALGRTRPGHHHHWGESSERACVRGTPGPARRISARSASLTFKCDSISVATRLRRMTSQRNVVVSMTPRRVT